jgi:hypothetical protein
MSKPTTFYDLLKAKLKTAAENSARGNTNLKPSAAGSLKDLKEGSRKPNEPKVIAQAKELNKIETQENPPAPKAKEKASSFKEAFVKAAAAHDIPEDKALGMLIDLKNRKYQEA